jgi:hypothetical protein
MTRGDCPKKFKINNMGYGPKIKFSKQIFFYKNQNYKQNLTFKNYKIYKQLTKKMFTINCLLPLMYLLYSRAAWPELIC